MSKNTRVKLQIPATIQTWKCRGIFTGRGNYNLYLYLVSRAPWSKTEIFPVFSAIPSFLRSGSAAGSNPDAMQFPDDNTPERTGQRGLGQANRIRILSLSMSVAFRLRRPRPRRLADTPSPRAAKEVGGGGALPTPPFSC